MSKSRKTFSKAWSAIKWASLTERVRRFQRRIYKAAKADRLQLVHVLQKKIIHSLDAKLLAVRQVTTLNKGKRSAGVDRIKITNSGEKWKLAAALHLNGRALPIRRVWIPKPGRSELRPLGIPTIQDRAKQALAKLALEPEWEARFEPNSYGFRPARGAHDAVEAIFLNLHHKTPKWVYDADIRKCFDRIDHDALIAKLRTFPKMEAQVKAWLKADIMEGYANAPKEISPSLMGTPQGGIISPLLANVALHGLEQHLMEFVAKVPGKPRPGANRGTVAKVKALGFVRYADDFVIIHENRAILELCVQETAAWLARVGLELSPEKSKLRDSREGFNFLGFQIIMVRKQGNYKVKITPAKAKAEKFLEQIAEVIKMGKAKSSYELIRRLRPMVIGWANYYRYCECKDTFSSMTHKIFQKLRAWVFRRDTRSGRREVKEKYFPSGNTYTFNGVKHRGNWVLVGKHKGKGAVIRTNFLPHMVWVKSEKFVKVRGDKSPFDGDFSYWGFRAPKYVKANTTVQQLLKKQKQKCTWCNNRFTSFDVMEIDHVIPLSKGGLDRKRNLQLLHRSCHIRKTAVDLATE